MEHPSEVAFCDLRLGRVIQKVDCCGALLRGGSLAYAFRPLDGYRRQRTHQLVELGVNYSLSIGRIRLHDVDFSKAAIDKSLFCHILTLRFVTALVRLSPQAEARLFKPTQTGGQAAEELSTPCSASSTSRLAEIQSIKAKSTPLARNTRWM